eukprot:NODE_367_length_8687_cov_0.577084.p10 type:complete len:102 gc:universal NODE_367_length_8687_cov_0.577084:448-143(-)
MELFVQHAEVFSCRLPIEKQMIWMSTVMTVSLVVSTKEYLYRLSGAPTDWLTSKKSIWEKYPFVGIYKDESRMTMVNLQQVLDEAPQSSYIAVYGITDRLD